MPSRDEELAPLIRGVFLPEDGELWAKPDCSQQEFRFVVHYAVIRKACRAADEAVERYRNDPDTDFHDMLAERITGLPRKVAKSVNFAKIYGAGVKKFAEMIGKPLQTRRSAIYDAVRPRTAVLVRQLSRRCQSDANRQGYTRAL